MQKPPQFSLAGILITISITAIYLALLLSPLRQLTMPPLIFGPIAAAVAAIVYGTGLRRAFAIGFIVPQTSIAMRIFDYFDPGNIEYLIVAQISGIFCGIVSLATAWCLLRSAQRV